MEIQPNKSQKQVQHPTCLITTASDSECKGAAVSEVVVAAATADMVLFASSDDDCWLEAFSLDWCAGLLLGGFEGPATWIVIMLLEVGTSFFVFFPTLTFLYTI